MMHFKSDTLSEQYKNEGNKSFVKKLFYEALLSFNKALCYAENKENLALAYGNRSAVYFELKLYNLCLKNIEWACMNKYPQNKIKKLHDRQERCVKLLKNEHPGFDLWSFLKLSYPANPQIPFMIEGLEVRNTKKYGRGVFTNRDLNIGDIIAIEEPVLVFLCEEGQYHRCCKCFKISKLNLIPCSKTAVMMFCSFTCRDKVYKNVENLDWMISENVQAIRFEKILSEVEEAFKGKNTLIKFLQQNDISKLKTTVFDYDFSNPKHVRMNQIKASLSLIPNTTRNTTNRIAEGARAVSNGNILIEKFLKQLAAASEKNCNLTASSEESIEGQTLYPFFSLINHSCNNNITTVTVSDVETIFYVVKPIKASEQLFLNYLGDQAPMMPTFIRQDRLFTTFDFICDCKLCNEDSAFDIIRANLMKKATEKAKFTRYIMKTDQEILQQIKENWKIVNNNPSSPDSLLQILHSHILLQKILTAYVEPTHRHAEDN